MDFNFLPFAIIHKELNEAIGCTEFSGIDRKNRKLEIGDLYSIIESEWPEKKEFLHSRIQYKISQKSRCSINTQ